MPKRKPDADAARGFAEDQDSLGVAAEGLDVPTHPGQGRLLVEQVTGRVRWRESAIAMAEAGVTNFVELGGKVVAAMIKRSAGDVETVSVVTMEDIEALARDL